MSQYNNNAKTVYSGPQQHYYPPPPPQYPPPHKGILEVDSNNPPPAPAFSMPPPPGPSPAVYPSAPHGYQQASQPAHVVVVEGTPAATEPAELPCNGLGVGWLLFIIGFVTGITWYVGAIMLCTKIDRREKPGYIACTVAAILNTIAIVIIVIVMVNATAQAAQSAPQYYFGH